MDTMFTDDQIQHMEGTTMVAALRLVYMCNFCCTQVAVLNCMYKQAVTITDTD